VVACWAGAACSSSEASSFELDFGVVMFGCFPDFCSIVRGSCVGSSSLCDPFVHTAYTVLCVIVLLKVEGKGRCVASGHLRLSCLDLGMAAVV
jgi:hypothetical protein